MKLFDEYRHVYESGQWYAQRKIRKLGRTGWAYVKEYYRNPYVYDCYWRPITFNSRDDADAWLCGVQDADFVTAMNELDAELAKGEGA